VQSDFAHSKSAKYRDLAELLLETDHVSEAERILDLLKEEELKEAVRGEAKNASARRASLTLSGQSKTRKPD
jgi:hypothetical protein